MSEVDEQTRHRFLQRLKNHYARVLTEGRWVAFTFGGRNGDKDQLQCRARDLVHEVIHQVLIGRRKWKPEVDFIAFMKLTMKSIASNQWQKDRLLESMQAEVENDEGSRVPQRQFAGEDNPAQQALDEQAAAARVYELLEAAGDDELLVQVIDAYLTSGCERPRDVAAKLGLPVPDIYQAQRKLERRVTARRKKVN